MGATYCLIVCNVIGLAAAGIISSWVMPNPEVTQDCELKYDFGSKLCSDTVGKDWRQHITNDELEDPKSQKRIFCCMKWDTSVCMDDYIKRTCSEDDYTEIHMIFENKIEYESKGNCNEYPYQSDLCKKNAEIYQAETNMELTNSSITISKWILIIPLLLFVLYLLI